MKISVGMKMRVISPNAPFGGEIVTVTSVPVDQTGGSIIIFAQNVRGEEEPFLSEELTFV